MTLLQRLTPASDDGAPILLVIPGAGYTAQAPMLYWPARAMEQSGWDIWSIDWHQDSKNVPRSGVVAFVDRCVAEALGGLPEHPAAVLGKSLGTFALPHFVRTEVRAVWLTPILTDDRVLHASQEASSRHLFVGGSDDQTWRPESLPATAPIITVPSANHSLERTGAAWQTSAVGQIELVHKVVEHLTG
jgi:hypothetical protein